MYFFFILFASKSNRLQLLIGEYKGTFNPLYPVSICYYQLNDGLDEAEVQVGCEVTVN